MKHRKFVDFVIFLNFLFAFNVAANTLERDTLVNGVSGVSIETLYKPSVLSADAKSLRIVNLQSAVGLPKGAMELFIQHRFGPVSSGAYNWYGIDQSFMRIGLDYGLSNAFTVGISRSSMNTTADAYMKWQFVGNKKTEKTVKMAWMSNITSDIRTRKNFTQEPYYYSNRLRFVNQLIITKNLSNVLAVGISPMLVHINLVDKKTDANDIAVLSGFARLKLNEKYAFTLELGTPLDIPEFFPKPINTSAYVPANPYTSVGFDIFTARHIFHLSVSNASSMNEGYLLVADNGKFSESLRFGFNIVRRW